MLISIHKLQRLAVVFPSALTARPLLCSLLLSVTQLIILCRIVPANNGCVSPRAEPESDSQINEFSTQWDCDETRTHVRVRQNGFYSHNEFHLGVLVTTFSASGFHLEPSTRTFNDFMRPWRSVWGSSTVPEWQTSLTWRTSLLFVLMEPTSCLSSHHGNNMKATHDVDVWCCFRGDGMIKWIVKRDGCRWISSLFLMSSVFLLRHGC